MRGLRETVEKETVVQPPPPERRLCTRNSYIILRYLLERYKEHVDSAKKCVILKTNHYMRPTSWVGGGYGLAFT